MVECSFTNEGVVGLMNPVAVTIKKTDVRIGDSFTFLLNRWNSLLNSQLKQFVEKQFGSSRVSYLTQVNDIVLRFFFFFFLLIINIRMIIILVKLLCLEC